MTIKAATEKLIALQKFANRTGTRTHKAQAAVLNTFMLEQQCEIEAVETATFPKSALSGGAR